MAKRRNEDEGPKAPITKAGLRKFLGIFRFVVPYRKYFILGLIALGFSSLTSLSFPYLAGKLLDAAQGNIGYTVNQVGSVFVLVLVFQSLFSFLRPWFFAQFAERSLADLRHELYKKMIWLPMSFFDSRRVGELMSRISSDVSTLTDAYTFMLAELMRQVITLVVGIVIISVLTPQLTLFMLCTFPLLVVAALFFGKFIRKLSKKTQDQLANANVIVEETLHSITVVKSFTNETFETRRYKKQLNDVVDTALKSSKYRGAFISFSIFSLFGGIIAVAWYGAYLVQSGGMTVGDLLSFVFYTTFIGASIAGLGDLYSQLQKTIGASERILEILDLKEEQSDEARSFKLKGSIEFSDVSFTYPTRTERSVLKHMSFRIEAGEKIALVGPSGSGKSTVISLLMRFYDLSDGAILVDGQNVSSYPLTGYRRNIGVVPQEVILFGGTIRENIAYGRPDATDAEIEDAARKANAWEFIERLPAGLDTVVGDRGQKLSGGQRQRVSIARAILKDPAILILDEATSSLDAASEKLVQDALEKLMENRTTIVIAHRLSTIREVDRILVIKDGEIAESGSHSELTGIDGGIYSQLLKLQFEVRG